MMNQHLPEKGPPRGRRADAKVVDTLLTRTANPVASYSARHWKDQLGKPRNTQAWQQPTSGPARRLPGRGQMQPGLCLLEEHTPDALEPLSGAPGAPQGQRTEPCTAASRRQPEGTPASTNRHVHRLQRSHTWEPPLLTHTRRTPSLIPAVRSRNTHKTIQHWELSGVQQLCSALACEAYLNSRKFTKHFNFRSVRLMHPLYMLYQENQMHKIGKKSPKKCLPSASGQRAGGRSPAQWHL